MLNSIIAGLLVGIDENYLSISKWCFMREVVHSSMVERTTGPPAVRLATVSHSQAEGGPPAASCAVLAGCPSCPSSLTAPVLPCNPPSLLEARPEHLLGGDQGRAVLPQLDRAMS